MTSRANGGSRYGAQRMASVFDALDAGWDDVPASTFPPRSSIRELAPASTLGPRRQARTSDEDADPIVEISETFAEDLYLEFLGGALLEDFDALTSAATAETPRAKDERFEEVFDDELLVSRLPGDGL